MYVYIICICMYIYKNTKNNLQTDKYITREFFDFFLVKYLGSQPVCLCVSVFMCCLFPFRDATSSSS